MPAPIPHLLSPQYLLHYYYQNHTPFLKVHLDLHVLSPQHVVTQSQIDESMPTNDSPPNQEDQMRVGLTGEREFSHLFPLKIEFRRDKNRVSLMLVVILCTQVFQSRIFFPRPTTNHFRTVLDVFFYSLVFLLVGE